MNAKLIPIRKPKPLELSLSDAALVAACGAGDPDALGVLYDRYARDVCRFISRLTYVEADEAEDLMQEAFLAAFRSARRFGGKSSVKTWIFGIAANLAKSRARSGRRGRLARSEIALRIVETPSSPDDEVIARDAMTRLQRGLMQLTHDLRVAFVLCHVEQVPGPEAAKTLGIPLGTLYRRLHEARSKLIDCMDGAWP